MTFNHGACSRMRGGVGSLLLLLLLLSTCSTEEARGGEGSGVLKPVRYILYDVNPGEGFNLRRDVYMRMAVFVRKLNRAFPSTYWVLVLPPWGHLYHWQSRVLGHQVPTGFLRKLKPDLFSSADLL